MLCERITGGTLHIISPSGEKLSFGEGAPEVELVIRDWSALSMALIRGDVGFGEAYVKGFWDSNDVEALLRLFLENESISLGASGGTFASRIFYRSLNAFQRRNTRAGSSRNIRAHYDVGNDFYRLWLDDSMTYSSALFGSENESLEQAQERKNTRLLSQLPKTAERILEIGCGWGGFAQQATAEGRFVTGVTVSPAQYDYATRRLGRAADIRLQDYRDINGKFDSIVSVEMIEAVGEAYWPRYFRTLKDRLTEGGVAALQVILVNDQTFPRYRRQSDFIRQYIFPGGMLVPPSKIRKLAGDSGLEILDFHRFGKDYARTLREWKKRFSENETAMRKLGYGCQTRRSWRYYFDFCAAGFSHGEHIDVAQISIVNHA